MRWNELPGAPPAARRTLALAVEVVVDLAVREARLLGDLLEGFAAHPARDHEAEI
jgi:hypothetical protein